LEWLIDRKVVSVQRFPKTEFQSKQDEIDFGRFDDCCFLGKCLLLIICLNYMKTCAKM